MAGKAVVGVRELKTRFGSYLRKVRQGRMLVVTYRGEPVAELRPLGGKSKSADAALAKLKARGAITQLEERPVAAFREIASRRPSVSDAVLEDRKDRF